MKHLVMSVLVAISCAACHRTVYSNFAPLSAAPVEEPADVAREAPGGWQHFFIWGWIPGERRINAAGACGGTDHVKRIETRQTFLQGLIAVLASYYINIYSPYTGAVICDQSAVP